MATAESRAAAAYAALRATAAAAEATLASARAEAAAAEAAAAAARATVDAKVADAQAAAASMRRHPCHAFSGSPPFSLLDARGSLRLITDAVHEDDALCLALTCRALRDALWARFPRRPAGDALLFISTVRGCVTGDLAGARVRTRDAAVVGTVGRLAWARGLDQPWPGPEPPEKFHVALATAGPGPAPTSAAPPSPPPPRPACVPARRRPAAAGSAPTAHRAARDRSARGRAHRPRVPRRLRGGGCSARRAD